MLTTCPNCGDQLTPVDLPSTPPWVCADCSRGWWNAELSSDARLTWDPITRSFPDAIRELAQAEA